jgi:deazaflavin-dependent oxidoreductase (nitroreductase family)
MDIRAMNGRVIEQYRAGSQVDGMHRERLILLTTTGAKSGQPHTTPLMFHPDGDRILIIASNAGAARHPDWFENLLRDPEVTVEAPDGSYRAAASVLTGAEHDEQWSRLTKEFAFLSEHEARAKGRVIPVVALARQR